ncbi:uncharacterized protein B0I36DRAFT_236427 [Microdochium trichocladiopsis]|uniref:Uncharacterized protein n=1 Tax=Microdochium trichocladiopsis TaxID=1682393 RepID=A0A9P9BTL5_9PEZI|nr:uncharacterized protein B0I36DRAFT_236427 [Microdochium trichocladiopsis]KAH7037062.1 hypothetical protein B0I36DRAFT_236427 [Microdochium trichocladiopsis]
MALLSSAPELEVQARAQIQEWIQGGELRRVQYNVTLPTIVNSPTDPLSYREIVAETTAVSHHVSNSIRAFYKQLGLQHAGLGKPDDDISATIIIDTQSFEGDAPCNHRRFHSRRLSLHDAETLQDLDFVSLFALRSAPSRSAVESQDMRPLSPLLLLNCLAHLPAVKELYVPWLWERPMPCTVPSEPMREHHSRPWEGPLRDARHEFGAAILEPEKYLAGGRIPATLTEVGLHFWTPCQIPKEDQSIPRPNLIYPADHDPVSMGLRQLATQLQVLDVRALITEDMFPPATAPAEEQWVHMRRLQIEFHLLRPDGRWYFTGPRGEDPHDADQGGFRISNTGHYPPEPDRAEDKATDEEWEGDRYGGSSSDYVPDMFRIEPCRERIEPLLAAFAQALSRKNMPALEVAELFAVLWWSPSESREEEYDVEDPDDWAPPDTHRWGVKYIAADEDESSNHGGPVVQWQVGEWRPSQRILSLFEALGRQEWRDFEYGHGRDLGSFDLTLQKRLH